MPQDRSDTSPGGLRVFALCFRPAGNAEHTVVTEISFLGFTCRVVSPDWARLIERDRLELMFFFSRTLEEIRELPETA